MKQFFNPFETIAGSKALLFGTILIILTGLIGYSAGVHFPDPISVKVYYGLPLWIHIIQGIINFILLGSILYLASMIISKSKVRAIDIYGTQAFARIPFILSAALGLIPSNGKVIKYLIDVYVKHVEPASVSTLDWVIFSAITIITLLVVIWAIALMYNAFKVSANVKGVKSGLTFTLSLILSLIAAGAINYFLFQTI